MKALAHRKVRRKFLRDLAVSALWLPAASAIVGAQEVIPCRRLDFAASSGAALDPVATDWANRVVTNGGTLPSQAYQQAVSDLVAGLKTDGIWSKMIFVHGFVPGPTYGVNPVAASCWAPATPILKGPIIDPLTLTNGSSYASQWPSDGQNNIGLNGVNNNKTTLGATAAAIWSSGNGASATNLGISYYLPDATFGSGQNKAPWGADDYNSTHRWRLRAISGNNNSLIDFGGNDISVNFNRAGGFYSVNRSATNLFKVHFASSSVSATTIYTDTTNDTNDPRASAFNFWILGENNPAGGCCDWNFNMSFVCGHPALVLSDFALLAGRVQTFRTAIGGGFV